MPVNIIDHRGLAQDALNDGPIQNIAYWLGQAGSPGNISSGVRSSRVAATAGLNTTETLIGNIPLLLISTVEGSSVPGTLNVGSQVRVTITGTCTSTNADVSTFTMRAGILGTVAGDASIATWVVTSAGSGSAVVFRAIIDITVRTLGASGTAYGTLAVQNTGVTGIAAVTNTVVASASAISALPTTTATFLDFSYVSAATTTTTTFQQCSIEVLP